MSVEEARVLELCGEPPADAMEHSFALLREGLAETAGELAERGIQLVVRRATRWRLP